MVDRVVSEAGLSSEEDAGLARNLIPMMTHESKHPGADKKEKPPSLYRISSYSSLAKLDKTKTSSSQQNHTDETATKGTSKKENRRAPRHHHDDTSDHSASPSSPSKKHKEKRSSSAMHSSSSANVNTNINAINNNIPCTKCSSSKDMPSLHYAAYAGHVKCLEFFLTRDEQNISRPGAVSMSMSMDKHKRTPLFYACAANHAECVAILLASHPEWIDVPDSQLDTPVHVCCFFGWDKCLEVYVYRYRYIDI